jgi:hypothetical protein
MDVSNIGTTVEVGAVKNIATGNWPTKPRSEHRKSDLATLQPSDDTRTYFGTFGHRVGGHRSNARESWSGDNVLRRVADTAVSIFSDVLMCHSYNV